MSISTGIAFAFVAMLAWGFGDFLIQKGVRKVGNMETLFVATAFGAIVLFPFVYKNIISTLSDSYALTILCITSLVLSVAAIFDFEALKEGNLSIVEPIWSLEIPVASFLAFFLLHERVSLFQIILVISLIFFLCLLAIHKEKIRKILTLEKGVVVAILGAIFMGGANFLMGYGGRVTDFVMINFFTDAFIAILCLVYIIYKGKSKSFVSGLGREWRVLLPMAISDKIAWLAFVLSMSLLPIAIAVALSESYIVVAVLLGLFLGHERLFKHQKIGLVGAIIVALVLASTAG
jgi:uncharacterized membrane protein